MLGLGTSHRFTPYNNYDVLVNHTRLRMSLNVVVSEGTQPYPSTLQEIHIAGPRSIFPDELHGKAIHPILMSHVEETHGEGRRVVLTSVESNPAGQGIHVVYRVEVGHGM